MNNKCNMFGNYDSMTGSCVECFHRNTFVFDACKKKTESKIIKKKEKENIYYDCIINNEKKAHFHCWEECANVVGASPMIGGHTAGQIKYTLAIVEYEDGTIDEVSPKSIKFTSH